MKKFIVVNFVIILVLAACGTNSAPATSPAANAATNTPASVLVTQPPASGGAAPSGADSATESSTSNISARPTETPSSSSASSGPCTDSASFMADVTVPDNTLLQPGEHFQKTWLIKNSGTCTWTNYSLVFSTGDQMSAPDSNPVQETAPGSTTQITVAMVAPNDENVTHARADFEIRNAGGAAIPVDTGTTLWVIIKVDNGEAPKGVGGSTSGTTGGSTGGTTGGTTNGTAGPGYATVTCAYTLDQSKVDETLTALNAYRAQNNIPAYNVNAQLTEAAQAHANDMACNQLFYHNGSNGSTPASRVAFSGYQAAYVTENVYGSYPPLDGPGVIHWWANDASDPRHNENLISTKYVEIGIGYAFSNNFGYYVIDFAVPK